MKEAINTIDKFERMATALENDLKLEKAASAELRGMKSAMDVTVDTRQLGKGKGRVLDLGVLTALYQERETANIKRVSKKQGSAEKSTSTALPPIETIIEVMDETIASIDLSENLPITLT